MRNFLSAAAIVFTLSGTAQAQDFDKGWEAYLAGDYATALQELRPLAEQGDVEMQAPKFPLPYSNSRKQPELEVTKTALEPLSVWVGFYPYDFKTTPNQVILFESLGLPFPSQVKGYDHGSAYLLHTQRR